MAVGVSLLVAWLVLLVVLLTHRPEGSSGREALRLLPDVVRLVRRLAADGSLPRGVRTRLWLLLGYLAFPIDLVPDFLPGIGYADDAIVVGIVLRSTVRRAGAEGVRRHWPGTDAGLAALWSACGLPGNPPARADRAPRLAP